MSCVLEKWPETQEEELRTEKEFNAHQSRSRRPGPFVIASPFKEHLALKCLGYRENNLSEDSNFMGTV